MEVVYFDRTATILVGNDKRNLRRARDMPSRYINRDGGILIEAHDVDNHTGK